MRTFRLRRDSIVCRVITGLLVSGFAVNVLANPTGMTVGRGSASIHQSGSHLTVTASQNTFLNWKSFNIAAGETTTFVQPSSTSIVWNRVNDPNPSQIFGTIQANGVVVLLNSSGFYFGPNSFVSAAGLVVSTANCAPPENGGGTWEFNGPPPLASIINYGQIQVGNGGSAFLIADQIENHGTIEAPGGSIGLAAGQTILLSERPDGRGMSLQVTLPQGSVDNFGNLIADGGTISLNAKVVNQNGILQANSVREQNGVIELVAAGSLTLGAGSQILAQGDASTPGSAGGDVTLKSGNNFSDSAGSQIAVTGGAQGGNGGNIEVSAPNVLSLDSSMDARAQSGWNGGTFFLDPVSITLGTSTAGGAIDVNTAFAGFSSIILQATGNITLDSGTVWDLSGSTGVNGGQLKLQAGGNIVLNDGSKIFDANNWAVTLQAGYNLANNIVMAGTGSITFDGKGSIQTGAGAINLTAGQDIEAGSGFIITTGGGSITAHALAGNIGCGTFAQGCTFKNSATSIDKAYDLSGGLGGISTVAGGDVNLIAGGNVTSVLPGNKGYYYNGDFFSPLNSTYATAGAGAYGRQAGNVNIVAGGDVTGNYMVANGTGSIFAGVKMDASGNPVKDLSGNYVLGTTGSAGTLASNPDLALGLVSGGWNVTAAKNIFLQEVRNPNGIFNVSGNAALKHYFDYAPNDFVNLSAGNQVQLGASASSLPRLDTLRVPVVYPSILNISAGHGGVVLVGDSFYNQLILFASPQGSLTINTTDGGSLTGKLPNASNVPQIFSLIVSDSAKKQYKTSGDFGLNDHAAAPIHLNNGTPVSLDIAGNMNLMLVGTPEAARISIGGNMNNSRFQGMNLAADDVSSIHVAGDINNRSAFTSVDLSQYSGTAAPDLTFLSQALSITPSAVTLASSFYFDPVTKVMTYQNIPGQTLASVLSLVQNLTVQVYVNGVPQWEDDLQTIPKTTTVSVMNAATALALMDKYNQINAASGLAAGVGPPDSTTGIIIGGGGKLDISARNMDLGTTAGIQSVGAGLYGGNSSPLAKLFNTGADLSIVTTGDLNMFSSSIASLNGGDLYINAGGNINVGSAEFTVNGFGARGIFSSSGSDVAVFANNDINLNGSRIAAFDGGNVTVESFNGDINAGVGGLGGVILTAYYVDPVTHALYQNTPTVFGSGILAETFGPRDARYPAPDAILGNVLVQTPNGNVNANKAGVVQLAFNHLDYPDATVEVLAGYELRDSGGNRLTADEIANGTPVLVSADRNIDANNSGVVAQNAILKATGDIDGAIFAKGNIDVGAVNNVNVTALAQGTANVSAGGDLSGTIIGIGGITASGGSVDATLLSNAAISGDTSGQTGFAQGTAANATSQAEQTEDAAKTTDDGTGEDADEQNKKKKAITLAQKVSRVTVLLPTKTN
ncbi:MAG: filamentous hemagglutinin N-terminal domain-containing protein [Verrucomicrobiales bacterium]|nr:filamentous hemagglutinin N-terminal domain-containing protein [Verrucomicrobiales bacterium]